MSNDIYKARFVIQDVNFVYSAPQPKYIKAPEKFEVGFVGKSNVGKSTLLNAICGRKSLARCSKTPGRTQALNFFDLRFREAGQRNVDGEKRPESRSAYMVDLPGYGYAEAAKSARAEWSNLIKHYLFERKNLKLLLLLVDCRRDPGEEERWLADLGQEGNMLLVLTKVDRMSRNELAQRKKIISNALNVEPDRVFYSALVGKKRIDISQLRDVVFGYLS